MLTFPTSCDCAYRECTCMPGWCGCPQESCESCGTPGYGNDGPYAREPGFPSLVGCEDPDLFFCAACDRAIAADAAEEALADAHPRVQALARGVRARGRVFVWLVRNQTVGAVLSRDDGAVA